MKSNEDRTEWPGWFAVVHYALAGLRYLISALVVCFAIASLLGLAVGVRNHWARQRSVALGGSETQGCVLDKLPETVSDPQIKIAGQTGRNGRVRLWVNERELDPAWADEAGRFSAPVLLARQVNRVFIACQDGKRPAWPAQTVQYIGKPVMKPEIRDAMKLPDGRVLLVGVADARSGISLLGKGVTDPPSGGYTGDSGVFVMMLDSGIVQRAESYELQASNTKFGDSLAVGLGEELRKADQRPVVRTGRLDLASDGLKLELEVTGPACFPYFGRLLGGEMAPLEFIQGVFGAWFSPDDESVQLKVLTGAAGQMTVRLTVPQYQGIRQTNVFNAFSPGPAGLRQWPLLTDQDTFTLAWGGRGPRWFSPAPGVLESQKAVWKGPLGELGFGLGEVAIPGDQPPVEKAAAQPHSPPPPTLRQLVAEFSLPAIFGPLAIVILSFLPFGWLLNTLRTRPDFCAMQGPEGVDVRQRIGAVTLVLGLLVLRWPVERLIDAGVRYLAQGNPFGVSVTAVLILWLAALAAMPAVAQHLAETKKDWSAIAWPRGSMRGLLAPLAIRAVVGAALLALGLWAWRNGSLLALAPEGPWRNQLGVLLGSLSLAGVVAVLVFAVAGFRVFLAYGLIWVAGVAGFQLVVWGIPQHSLYVPPGAALAGAAIVAAAVIPIRRLWPPQSTGAKSWLRFAAVALLLAGLAGGEQWTLALWFGGMVTVWVYIRLCLHLAEAFWPKPSEPAARFAVWGAYLVAAIVCYPSEKVRAQFSQVTDLQNDCNSLAKYLALAAILVWLARTKESERHWHAWLAAALFAFFLVGSAGYVLYVPVPLLVGYFVTQRWLFRAGAIQGYRGLTGNKERRAAIEELIHWRWLNRMRESYRAAQDKKLQKGESTLEQHRQAIAAFEQTAAGPEPASHALAAARDRALSAGPGDSAWSNAITAVKYGAPLALAPVFFSVYRFASDAWNSPYVIPEFVLTVALQLCYWLFMAWFFGYYYRHFPGSTGLGKGAYFATAVAVPYLCLQLLLMQPIAQMGSFVIWAGEVFAYTTLLGLFAFDCEVLRQCGLSWQQLTAIHRVPTLSAFGSSLIAALGPLVLAVAHGRARDIANFALSFLGNLYPNGSAGGGQ